MTNFAPFTITSNCFTLSTRQNIIMNSFSARKNEEWSRTIPPLATGFLIIYCCNIKAMQCHYNFNRFITSFTITSFSSGFDSAIINVIATNVPSLSLFSLSKNNALFLSKNSRNSDAAILSPLYQVHLQASLTEYQLFS